MSIIIRLQNLPLTAKAADIREFFGDLKIPKGAVNIVGGPEGDAFIGFATDEDARLAMRFDGNCIHHSKIRLLLSSRREMESVISNAHAMAAAVFSGNKPALPVSQVDLSMQNRTKPVEITSSESMHQKNVKGDATQFVSGGGGEGGAYQPLQRGHQQHQHHQPTTSLSNHHSYQQHFESGYALSQPNFPTTQPSFQQQQQQSLRSSYQPPSQQPSAAVSSQQPFGFSSSGGNCPNQNLSTQPNFSLSLQQQPPQTQQIFVGNQHDYLHASQTGEQTKTFDGNNQQPVASAFESQQNKTQSMVFGNNRPIFEQPTLKTHQQNVQPPSHFAAVSRSSQPVIESSYKMSSTHPQLFAANRQSGVVQHQPPLRQPLLSLDPQLNSTSIITTTSSTTGFHVTNVPNQSIFTFVQSKAVGVDSGETVATVSSKSVEAVGFEYQQKPSLAASSIVPSAAQQSDEFSHVELSRLPSELLRPANLESFLAPTVPLTLSSVKFVHERSGGAQLVLVRFGCRADAQRLLLRNGERGIRVKMLAKEDFERAEDGKFLSSSSSVDDHRSGGKAMKRDSRAAAFDEGGRGSSGARSRSSRKKRRDDRSLTRRTRSRSKTPTDRRGSSGGAATRSRSRSPHRKERDATSATGVSKKDASSMDHHRVCVQLFNVPYRTTNRDMDKFLSSLGALHYTKATKILPAGKTESDRWVVEFASDRDARPVLRANRAQLQLFQRYLRSESISSRAADTLYDSMNMLREHQSRSRDSVSPAPPTRRTEQKKQSPSAESPSLTSKLPPPVGDAKSFTQLDTWRKGKDTASVFSEALNGPPEVVPPRFSSNVAALSSALLPLPQQTTQHQSTVMTSQAQLLPSMRSFPNNDSNNLSGRNGGAGGAAGGLYGHHKKSGASSRFSVDDAVRSSGAPSPPPKMVLEASTEEELIRRGELPPTSFGAFSSPVVTNERYGASGRLGGIDGLPRHIRHQFHHPVMMHGVFGPGRGFPPVAHRTLLPSGPRFASRGSHFHLNAFRPPTHFGGAAEGSPNDSSDDTMGDNGWRNSNVEEASVDVSAPIGVGDGKLPPSLLSLRFGGPPVGLPLTRRAPWSTTAALATARLPLTTRSNESASGSVTNKKMDERKSMEEDEKPVAEEKAVKNELVVVESEPMENTKNAVTVTDIKCVDMVDVDENGADERKLSVVDDATPQQTTVADDIATDTSISNITETVEPQQPNADDDANEDNDALVAADDEADGFFTRHRGLYDKADRQRRPILGFVTTVCSESMAERRQRTVIRMCGVPPMVYAERLCQFLDVPLIRPSENICRVPNGDLYVNLTNVALATRATVTRNGKSLGTSRCVKITQLSRARMCRAVMELMELQDAGERMEEENSNVSVDGNLKDSSDGKGCTNSLGMETEEVSDRDDYSTGEEEEEIIVISSTSNNNSNSANSSSGDDANAPADLRLAIAEEA